MHMYFNAEKFSNSDHIHTYLHTLLVPKLRKYVSFKLLKHKHILFGCLNGRTITF